MPVSTTAVGLAVAATPAVGLAFAPTLSESTTLSATAVGLAFAAAKPATLSPATFSAVNTIGDVLQHSPSRIHPHGRASAKHQLQLRI